VTMEITANQIFSAGHCAPRGTYLCLKTGIVHRLSRPTTLPQGGPFRMVAPTEALGPMVSAAVVAPAPAVPQCRWPEEDTAHHQPDSPGWFDMLAAFRISRAGHWW
jgi:hypothetical protein